MRKLTRILLSALVLLMIFSVSVVSAQDEGLSEDELAILERVLALNDVIDGYESFVVDYTNISSSSQDLNFVGIELAGSERIEVAIRATVIRGESVNVAATITANIERVEDNVTTAYTIQAEARYVDEVLYVNILDIEGVDGSDAPSAPEGWQVAEEFNYPFYYDLGLGDFAGAMFDLPNGGIDEGEYLVEIFEQLATSLTVKGDEIDGVAVDVISITVGFEGLSAFMGDDIDLNDPIVAMVFRMLSEQNDLVTYSLGVDGDDNVLGVAFRVDFNLSEIDVGEIDASLEGATMSFGMEQAEITEFSQINESFDPVEAP